MSENLIHDFGERLAERDSARAEQLCSALADLCDGLTARLNAFADRMQAWRAEERALAAEAAELRRLCASFGFTIEGKILEAAVEVTPELMNEIARSAPGQA
jgi:hypothetical protein